MQNVTDESILIVRGVGGKELLKNELENKQANITYQIPINFMMLAFL